MIPVRFGLLLIVISACAVAQTESNETAQRTKCDVSPISPDCWRKVDAGPFSILAPQGWQFRQLAGVDSYVGEFVGDGMVLTFDFGRYSTELRHKQRPVYMVAKKQIDGHDAKLVSPRTPASGVTGVYVSANRHAALCIWGKDFNSEQQQLALKIFDTIRFGGPMPTSVVPPPPPPPAN